MTATSPAGPIAEDDATIRAALTDADIPSLIPALAYSTGDMSLLRDEFRPDPLALAVPQGGLSEQAQQDARELAFAILCELRDGTRTLAPAPGREDVAKIIDFVTRGAGPDYEPLLLEELNLDDSDMRAPGWTKDEVAPDTPFHVVVVGAGMSGLLAGCRLKQAGVGFTIVDKNPDVGGTWLENTYPGCRVDNPNHVYSYSFAQREDWPSHFSSQPVLLRYFGWFADEHGLRDHVRLGTEVLSAEFDDPGCVWRVHVRGPDGDEVIEANALISAVGQLNRPLIPDIPGRDSFRGPMFHSGQWDDSVDLRGKRVTVIGTGASAAQFVPVVAEQASQLRVYQRTPNWLAPTPHYHEAVPDGLLWLFGKLPSYQRWYRAWLFWRTADGMLPAFSVDPDWDQPDRSVGPANEMVRLLLEQYLTEQFADAPDLVEAVIPPYPPAAKRIILDNGAWAGALKRDDVELVTDPISEITPDGVRTADGVEHPADVILFGTGFQASRFLTPMRVRGRDGADLHGEWDGDARAYVGVTVPRFPNLFLLYGPNTNIVVNGSTVYFAECEMHYVLQCVRLLLEGGHRAMEPRREVHDAYNERIDEGNRMMAWGAAHVNTWYRNAKGRIAQNWPFTMLEFWKQTRTVDPSDYELL